MSKYKGLFTFDEDNHRYVPIAQADGIIDTMGYEPDSKPAEPLIKDEKIRKAVRAWAEACGVNRVVNGEYDNELCAKGQQFYGAKIVLTKTVALPRGRNYSIAELCGEEEE